MTNTLRRALFLRKSFWRMAGGSNVTGDGTIWNTVVSILPLMKSPMLQMKRSIAIAAVGQDQWTTLEIQAIDRPVFFLFPLDRCSEDIVSYKYKTGEVEVDGLHKTPA
ncbi:hypothetical protein D3C81_1373920 [compost metagenome]